MCIFVGSQKCEYYCQNQIDEFLIVHIEAVVETVKADAAYEEEYYKEKDIQYQKKEIITHFIMLNYLALHCISNLNPTLIVHL